MSKILHLIDTLGLGGKERQLVELLKGLSKYTEIKTELAVMTKVIGYKEIGSLNVTKHFVTRKTKRDISVLRLLWGICRSFQPDIITVWDSMTALLAIPLAKTMGLSLVNGMLRNIPERQDIFCKEWRRAKFVFPFSDVIISNSHAALKAFKAPSHKSICIANGFDSARVENVRPEQSIREKYGFNNNRVVGMVASFTDKKDFRSFITAANIVLDSYPDVIFVTIGDGPQLEECKKLTHLVNRDRFFFLGSQDDVESIVNTFEIGVLTSYREGIPNSVMEYMALAKPVVATDCGGTSELVLHNKTGFLVGIEDVNAIVKAILRLLGSQKLSEEMGHNGKSRIVKEFNQDKMVAAYKKMYETLLSKG